MNCNFKNVNCNKKYLYLLQNSRNNIAHLLEANSKFASKSDALFLFGISEIHLILMNGILSKYAT